MLISWNKISTGQDVRIYFSPSRRFLLLPNRIFKSVAILFILHRESSKKEIVCACASSAWLILYFLRLNSAPARYYRLRSFHAYFSPFIFYVYCFYSLNLRPLISTTMSPIFPRSFRSKEDARGVLSETFRWLLRKDIHIAFNFNRECPVPPSA